MILDVSFTWSVIAFVLLVGLGAFFASAETAVFSLTRSQIDEITERTDPASRRLARLLEEPRRTLIVLLTGSTFVSILAATVAALATARLLGNQGSVAWVVFAVQVVIVSLVTLIFSEVMPKLAAIRNPLRWSLRASGLLTVIAWLLRPVIYLLLPFTDTVAKALGVEKRRLWISEEEIKTLVEVGEEHGALEKSEKELIHSIFEFGDTTVREIMVPRTDMVCLNVATPTAQVLEVIQATQHSRLPIYEGSIDNIIGILHTKDLLAHYPFDENLNLRAILRKPSFVPETKLIAELLKQFQEQRIHMTIVVDEYGGTAGLVTLENVIEEIVGEIQDEHDAERPLWTRLDENTVVADARLDVETVNEVLGADVIPTDQDFETLGGFILDELGEFPVAKQRVEYHNFEFVIEEVRGHRLGRVRIIRREQHSEAAP